jgi:hypothetical protein
MLLSGYFSFKHTLFFYVRGLSKKYPAIFFPSVSNGERVGKLRVMVEGTFMRMRDFCCLATPPDASVAVSEVV